MNNYIYSAALNMICATALKTDYEKAGTWPDDGLPLDDETAKEFMGAAPLGKVLSAGENSLPVWADAPPLTEDEALAQAEQRKASLNAWLDYIDALNLIDVAAASISWPVPPSDN